MRIPGLPALTPFLAARGVLSAVFVLASITTAAAACDEATQTEDLNLRLEAAQAAYQQLDEDAFQAEMSEVESIVGCLAEPITPRDAALTHRMRGLAYFLAGDGKEASNSFASARAIQPDYVFPATLVPDGNPVWELYVAVDPAEASIDDLDPPAKGDIKLDGRNTLQRRIGQPVIFQLMTNAGAVGSTALIDADKPVPDYVSRNKPAPMPVQRKGLNTPLAVTAGVLAAGAVGLGVGAMVAHQTYQNNNDGKTANTDLDERERRLRRGQKAVNGLTVATVGVSAAAAGCGLGAVLTGRF